MPIAVSEFETVVSEVAQKGAIDPGRETTIREFLEEYQRKARELYDAAILVSSQIYERERIAQFWQNQLSVCEAQLAYLNRLDRRLRNVHSQLEMSGYIEQFELLVDAIKRRYEFHA